MSLASLPDGWFMEPIRLDDSGFDSHGWWWGHGLRLWRIFDTDQIESLSVRADSPVEALTIVTLEGWPPRQIKRYNWEYGSP